jgi:lysozyme
VTIFGPDISSYEHGLNISGLTDSFVIAKVTEGTYYRDADWPVFRDAARRAGKLLVGYHFVTGEDPHAQAANLASWIGDRSIPVMLDFEPTGSSHPTHAQQLAVADAVKSAGMRVRLSYTPHWYWQQIGSPDLTGLTARGIGVVSSNYPKTSITDPPRDYAADGGDSGPGWALYGGIAPLLWQFTDAGVEQQRMDFNAFRGSVAELAAFLGSTTPIAGDDMQLSDQITFPPYAVQSFPDYGFQGPVTVGDLLAWTAARVSHIANHLAAPVDVNALAAAIAPHLTAGATADQIAQAVAQHLTLTVGSR